MHAVQVSDPPGADEARSAPRPPGDNPANTTAVARAGTRPRPAGARRRGGRPPPVTSGSVTPARVAGLSPEIAHFRTETAGRIHALARAGLQSFLAHARGGGAAHRGEGATDPRGL